MVRTIAQVTGLAAFMVAASPLAGVLVWFGLCMAGSAWRAGLPARGLAGLACLGYVTGAAFQALGVA